MQPITCSLSSTNQKRLYFLCFAILYKHDFHVVRRFPIISLNESWPKEFIRMTVFCKDYQKLKELILASIPLVIFKFCTTKNLTKKVFTLVSSPQKKHVFLQSEEKNLFLSLKFCIPNFVHRQNNLGERLLKITLLATSWVPMRKLHKQFFFNSIQFYLQSRYYFSKYVLTK